MAEPRELNSFDDWVVAEYERTDGFTALVVLFEIGMLSLRPLRSTFLHVIGAGMGEDRPQAVAALVFEFDQVQPGPRSDRGEQRAGGGGEGARFTCGLQSLLERSGLLRLRGA